jgi:hypothetical protein
MDQINRFIASWFKYGRMSIDLLFQLLGFLLKLLLLSINFPGKEEIASLLPIT